MVVKILGMNFLIFGCRPLGGTIRYSIVLNLTKLFSIYARIKESLGDIVV